MKHPKTTPPRPYTPKKKPAPYLSTALDKELAENGGRLISDALMEEITRQLREMSSKAFRSMVMSPPNRSGKTSMTTMTGLRGLLYPADITPHSPYGTLMIGLTKRKSGMALGNGQVYSFEDDAIDTENNWAEDTE